jgi:hypothetical protein
MRLLFDEWTNFDRNGRTFAAKLVADEAHGAPWDEDCGHGPVSEWTTRDKAPGELVLCEDGRSKRYYDFATAVRKAKTEGWNSTPYYPPGVETRGQRAAKAALSDFNYLRDWCLDRWCYVGVVVAPVCDCCGEVKEDDAESLWGIESNADNYLSEVAIDLAD